MPWWAQMVGIKRWGVVAALAGAAHGLGPWVGEWPCGCGRGDWSTVRESAGCHLHLALGQHRALAGVRLTVSASLRARVPVRRRATRIGDDRQAMLAVARRVPWVVIVWGLHQPISNGIVAGSQNAG